MLLCAADTDNLYIRLRVIVWQSEINRKCMKMWRAKKRAVDEDDDDNDEKTEEKKNAEKRKKKYCQMRAVCSRSLRISLGNFTVEQLSYNFMWVSVYFSHLSLLKSKMISIWCTVHNFIPSFRCARCVAYLDLNSK